MWLGRTRTALLLLLMSMEFYPVKSLGKRSTGMLTLFGKGSNLELAHLKQASSATRGAIDKLASDVHTNMTGAILKNRPNSQTDIPQRVLDGFRGKISKTIKEQFYGGESDLKDGRGHVGGFIFNDSGTYEPHLWRWMAKDMQVKKILDVGCGLGISTDFFIRQGMQPTCLEGSREAMEGQKWSPYLTESKPTTCECAQGPTTVATFVLHIHSC
jgi:hypothetical protein